MSLVASSASGSAAFFHPPSAQGWDLLAGTWSAPSWPLPHTTSNQLSFRRFRTPYSCLEPLTGVVNKLLFFSSSHAHHPMPPFLSANTLLARLLDKLFTKEVARPNGNQRLQNVVWGPFAFGLAELISMLVCTRCRLQTSIPFASTILSPSTPLTTTSPPRHVLPYTLLISPPSSHLL